MKKLVILLVFFSPILISNYVYSIDTATVKYFPLAVGNSWTYTVFTCCPYPTQWLERDIITRDTIINGKKYFYINGDLLNSLYRVDSNTCNVYSYLNVTNCPRTPNEVFYDSLKSRANDTFYHCNFTQFDIRVCKDTSIFTFLGINYKAKRFRDVYEITGTETRYAQYLGPISAVRGDPYAWDYTLKGCVINGIVYGDTTMSGMNPISNQIPENYMLYQNYPNPFNPATKIKFDLPKDENTKIIIYDILGREVAILVNEKLSIGTYEVEWDATNFASGVYFYRLEAGSYKDVKKMLLIK